MQQTPIILGTRPSKLAMWQSESIASQLQQQWSGLTCTLRTFTTSGDRILDTPLPAIGGKGLFTSELENALRNGEIDLAVHSLKDLPTQNAEGLTIGTITQRTEVRDALLTCHGWTLATLPQSARVGTSSLRRQAQLLAVRPDLHVHSIRGNVDTRINKLQRGDYDAILLAGAGLSRLGLTQWISEWLSLDVMLPAPGQGALAVQCRADDADLLTLLAKLNDPTLRTAVEIERGFLSALGGGCSAPIASYARPTRQTGFRLWGLVASLDGKRVVRVEGEGTDPNELAQRLAQQALNEGAREILSSIVGAVSIPHIGDPSQNVRDNDSSPKRRMDDNGENVRYGNRTYELNGKRVIVTRAETQADTLLALLTDQGATALPIPTIRIQPKADLRQLDAKLKQLDSYDWLLFTSQNAVTIVCERASSFPPHLSIAAVGAATAQALRTRGVEPAVVAQEQTGESLATGLGTVAGQRILLPRAAQGRPELPALLRAAGAIVEDVVVYDTLPVEFEAQTWQTLEPGFDAIFFTSPSTASHFVEQARSRPGLFERLSQSAIICIGPTTAQSVRELNLPVTAVAKEASDAGLVQALIDLI